MSRVIYVDVLLMINLFVNYFLLLAVCVLLRLPIRRLRLLAACAVGALYSLIIFLPELNTFLSLLLRLICSSVMVMTAYKVKNLKMFLRSFTAFFLMNFSFAGIMLAVWLAVRPAGMFYQNGAIYFDIDIVILALSTVVCYIVISIISHFIKQKVANNHIINIEIGNNSRSVTGCALLDTGNHLKEPFSGFPVIVCDYDFVKDLMDEKLKLFVKKCYSYTDDKLTDAGVRFVSYKSVGGDGLLAAFRPESVEIEDGKKRLCLDEVYIAVCSESLSGGEYSALVGNLFFEMAEKGESGDERLIGKIKKLSVSHYRQKK